MLFYSVACLVGFNRWAHAHVAEHMVKRSPAGLAVFAAGAGKSAKKSQLSSLL